MALPPRTCHITSDNNLEVRMNAVRVATALLVDDDVSSRQANQERLEDDGYTVVVARDQAEGLDRAKQSAPNVIFIHLVSEGVGSLPFIEALRADDVGGHIPVVVLTSLAPPRLGNVAAVNRDLRWPGGGRGG